MENLPSNKWSVTTRDWIKGFLFACAAAVIGVIGQTLESGLLPQWHQIVVALKAGLGAGILYILRKFISDDVKVAQKTIDRERQKQVDRSVKIKKKINVPKTLLFIGALLVWSFILSTTMSSCRSSKVQKEAKQVLKKSAEFSDCLMIIQEMEIKNLYDSTHKENESVKTDKNLRISENGFELIFDTSQTKVSIKPDGTVTAEGKLKSLKGSNKRQSEKLDSTANKSKSVNVKLASDSLSKDNQLVNNNGKKSEEKTTEKSKDKETKSFSWSGAFFTTIICVVFMLFIFFWLRKKPS